MQDVVLSLFASGLPPAGPVPEWHGRSSSEYLTTGRFPEKKQRPSEVLFLRNADQAHKGTLVPKKTEKPGYSAPTGINLDTPFSITNLV